MSRPNYGGAGNSHYPHSHDSGSGYTRGGGLFSACFPKLLVIGVAAVCFVVTAARVLQFVASTAAGAL